jgi:hypothetical protein
MPWGPPEHALFTLVSFDGPQYHNPMGLYVPAEAQIQIYPVPGLNDEVQPIVAGLQQILADRPDLTTYETTAPELDVSDPQLAMLPPSNAQQAFRSQIEYLDFAGGSGIRYLTMLSQGPVPVSNYDLFYTFQGLTDDGQTYVAAYFPVSLAELPDSQQIDEAGMAALMKDWPGYLKQTAIMLNGQPAAAFTPDLAAIDALISSLSVTGMTPPAAIAAEGIWPGDGESVDGQPVLQWPAVPGATSYQVVVLDDVAFPPVVAIDQAVVEPLLDIESSLAPGHYGWTVRALAGDGAVLAELNQTFLVKDAVTLVNPAMGAAVGPGALLEWNAYPGASSYQVIVIDDDAFPPLVALDKTTAETSTALPSPLPSGSYSWTVRALAEDGTVLAELNSAFLVEDGN